MTKRNLKKVAALLVSTTMIMGSCLTAFAGDVSQEGTGEYEGGEMQYPTLSVTLPTIPTKAYNYIADPNGLIKMTEAKAYTDSEFEDADGIYFLTTPKTNEEGSKNKYTGSSAALTLTNENAQDIDVTIKLEQKEAGDEGIVYSDTDTFETTDKDKKLYLAVTDGAETDPEVDALTADAAATITTLVAGVKDNYNPGWTEDDGYLYELKDEADLEDWNSISYNLVGALNTNATWEDELEFPTIKVTWSFAEHKDDAAPSADTSYNFVKGTDLVIPVSLGSGSLAATGIAKVEMSSDGTTYNPWERLSFEGTNVTIAGGAWAATEAGSKRYVKITFNDEAETAVVVTITITES